MLGQSHWLSRPVPFNRISAVSVLTLKEVQQVFEIHKATERFDLPPRSQDF
jgi:hypothetical protein